jgi:hypothetical protein
MYLRATESLGLVPETLFIFHNKSKARESFVFVQKTPSLYLGGKDYGKNDKSTNLKKCKGKQR